MDRRVLDKQVWSDLIAAGAQVDTRAGDLDTDAAVVIPSRSEGSGGGLRE